MGFCSRYILPKNNNRIHCTYGQSWDRVSPALSRGAHVILLARRVAASRNSLALKMISPEVFMVKSVLYNTLNSLLRKGGFVLIPARDALDRNQLLNTYGLRNKEVIRLNTSPKGGLRQHLIAQQQT